MTNEERRLAFNVKGFCQNCGVYKRPGLTWANYIDAFGRQHRKAILCADCYSELVGSETETDDITSVEGGESSLPCAKEA